MKPYKDFYVYFHIRPDLNIPFYVGKGRGKRSNSKNGRNPHWYNIVNKNKGVFDVKIFKSNLTEEQALNQEKILYNILIKEGYILCNIAEVGHNNGAVGCKRTKQHKLALSKAVKGRVSPNKGKKHGPLSEDLKYWKGKTRPKNTKIKQSESQYKRWEEKGDILRSNFRKNNGIPIIQLNPQNYEVINKFNSIVEGKEKTGIKTIDKCIRGEQKTAGGFLWVKKHPTNPYYDIILEKSKIRIFTLDPPLDEEYSSEEKWHQDKEDRTVKVLEGKGWMFQRDNELPIELKEGDTIFIPAYQIHRTIKGTTNLKIQING